MRNFFAVIVFALFVAVTSSASASDIFVCSVGEIDYYITESFGGNKLTFTNALGATITTMKHNEPIDVVGYVFFLNDPSGKKPLYMTIKDGQKSNPRLVNDDELAPQILMKLLSQ